MGGDDQSDEPVGADSREPVPLDAIPLHSTNLLTLLDETGTVQYESPAIERIFGYDQDELVGEPVADYFHSEDRDRVLEAFQTVLDSEEYTVKSVEYRHEREDGSYLWVESVASANPTPDGQYVVNTRDVSDRRARERELEASVSRLDDFASVVSHDLRNPLNVATGRLELARETGDFTHFDAVARAHERMETLIDKLLTLAKFGKPVQELESVDLAAVSESGWRTVVTEDAELVVDIDRLIRADRSRLRQLLENLVRNAVEHGGPQVTVTIGELPDQRGIYLADDGQGIAEDRRERVFESGYSTGNEGPGVGLTIVREIVEAHGWDIELSESITGGARFEIRGVEFVE